MRTAIAFNRIIRRQLQRHAAWLPVVSPFSLGDYGIYERGIFSRLGNITDLGVDFDPLPGGTATLKFETSAGLEVSLFVEGQGKVPQLPATDVQAKAEFEYKRARSFLLRAPSLTSTALSDIAGTATHLAQHPRWRRRYKLVTELLVADEATIIATASRNNTVTVEGKANVLKDFVDGKVGAGVTVKASSELALEIVGDSGPVALKLAKVRGSGRVGLEGLEAGQPAFEQEPTDEDYEPEDDL
ncbi:MAG: hypothetical protein K0V04_21225 [Deltaproteobacteria bacterium]|nr:hypothetical protein [Deltaproteobacteria bacterium]